MSNASEDTLQCNCLGCSSSIVMIPVITDFYLATGIYSGTCTTCKNKKQYLCKACYGYSSAKQAPGRYSGGRRSGIFSGRKSLNQHYKSSTHILATEDVLEVDNNEFGLETDSNECNDEEVDPIINNSSPNNISKIPLEDIKKAPFHHNSNSPSFFVNEQKFPGTGAQYLTAKAFSLRVDDVSFDEVNYTFMMSSLLCQLTQSQQQILANVMFQTINAKDPQLSIFKKT